MTRQLAGLWPMVEAAADATVRSLAPDGLPAASMDYWENSVQVTLGTAAALLTGLRAAADIAGELGHSTSAAQWARAATRLADGIAAGFGRHGYHRLPFADSGDDAAVTFLGPPFAAAGPAVVSAITDTERSLRLPNGGMLPGTDWPGNRTTAWTAETAFFALFDAETGHERMATQTADLVRRAHDPTGHAAGEGGRAGATRSPRLRWRGPTPRSCSPWSRRRITCRSCPFRRDERGGCPWRGSRSS